MKTITYSYFEVGDKVKLKDDYRSWKKDELAKITKIYWEGETFMSLQLAQLEPLNKSEKDIHVLYTYLLEFQP